ncbi:hypothetical protein [Myxococcus landrumensis]|uniref:Lipoprotein n=1 Tax=Myxococcus landrumensis TaxID=2813577 RepID=A0ABX7NHS2_9BACT|nr:hypothetical protein [Myxococcus landrumus]QSQ17904.1 hypothetical protein JY572_18500 [Myxococcus landrumus]
MTMQTNPVKRSYRNNLWNQFNAASCSRVSDGSNCIVGFGLILGHPPVPC